MADNGKTYLKELAERYALSAPAVSALAKMLPPPDYTRESARWGDEILCFKCQNPLPEAAFPGKTDTICKVCLGKTIESARAVIANDAERGLSGTIQKLADRDVPANPAGVARMLKKLDKRDTSVPEMVLDLLDELQGTKLAPEQRMGIPRFYGHEKDLLKLMADLVNKRDESLFGQNPYQDVTPRELLGSVLEALIDEMISEPAYAETVAKALVARVPKFTQLVHTVSGRQPAIDVVGAGA